MKPVHAHRHRTHWPVACWVECQGCHVQPVLPSYVSSSTGYLFTNGSPTSWRSLLTRHDLYWHFSLHLSSSTTQAWIQDWVVQDQDQDPDRQDQDKEQDRDCRHQDREQDQDFRPQDQDQDQEFENWASRRLETKTQVSRTPSLLPTRRL